MKKKIIIILIVIVGGALLILPLLNNDSPNEITNQDPVSFTFNKPLAIRFGEEVKIEFSVNVDDLKKVELLYNNEVIGSWDNPKKGKLSKSYLFSKHGIGRKNLVLRYINNEGSERLSSPLNTLVLSDIQPEMLTVQIVNTFPHSDSSYTQGLEFYKGELYEGTGDNMHVGDSKVGIVDMKTGGFSKKMGIGTPYFGEGITILNDMIYQLTWQNKTCFVWDLEFNNIKEFNYQNEGWGLCNNGSELIMSDGSARIAFRDPESFAVKRTIEVCDNKGIHQRINELEYIDGKIYANVYTTDAVLVIDPNSGKVLQIIDASNLTKEIQKNAQLKSGEVLNGIAYNNETNQLLMTGKNWPKMFEVTFKKK